MKLPLKLTPLALLVTMPAGSCASGTMPVNCPASRLVKLLPLPVKLPLKLTPLALLVSTLAGSRASGIVPVNCAAFRLVKPPPSPAKTELVIKAFVMERPATTLVASAALPPLAEFR